MYGDTAGYAIETEAGKADDTTLQILYYATVTAWCIDGGYDRGTSTTHIHKIREKRIAL